MKSRLVALMKINCIELSTKKENFLLRGNFINLIIWASVLSGIK